MEHRPYARFHSFPVGPILAAGLAVLAACGGHTQTHTTAPNQTAAAAPGKSSVSSKTKKDAAQSPGLRDFDAGLRALKLGGPEANQRAAESFQRAVDVDPTLWEAWYDLGVARWHLGDDRAAIAALSKALSYAPAGADKGARLARAEASRRMRKFGDARSDYEAVFTKDPNDLGSRLRYASLLRESGDTDGSIKAVREVLKRNAQGKDLADANVELGLDYMAANHPDLAELVLSKAAQVDPKNPRVWNALGLLALKEGKDQEAFQRLDHATDLDPSFRDARFNKATVLLDAGDYGLAKNELTAALKGLDDGADLDALVALGVAYRGLGDYPQARATWDRVLKVAPMQPDALYDMGVLQMDFLKDETKARDFLTRFIAAAPDEHPQKKDAQTRLGQLEPVPAAAKPDAPAPAKPGPATPAPQKPTKKKRRRRLRVRPRHLSFLALLLLLVGGSANAAPAKKAAPKKSTPAKPAAKPAPPSLDPTPAPAPDGSATVSVDPKATSKKEKTFDFAAMGIEGKVLAPQVLYLLGRIKVELEKGSLEGRSFIPELVRSVDEGGI